MLNNNQLIPPISANPGFTNRINRSGSLQKITRHVVIYVNSNQFDVYRKSTNKPGWYSRETYTKLGDDSFKRSEKDKDKYENPTIPEGAFSYDLNGIILYSMQQLDEERLGSIGHFIETVHK